MKRENKKRYRRRRGRVEGRRREKRNTYYYSSFLACPHKDPLHGVYQRKHQKAVSMQYIGNIATPAMSILTKIISTDAGDAYDAA